MWGADFRWRVRVVADVSIALVICEDNDNVWLLIRHDNARQAKKNKKMKGKNKKKKGKKPKTRKGKKLAKNNKNFTLLPTIKKFTLLQYSTSRMSKIYKIIVLLIFQSNLQSEANLKYLKNHPLA